jgi:hypothetical protein
VADIDGDRASDLVWRHRAPGGGENALWQMYADQMLGAPFLPTVNDLNWELIGR